MSTPIDVIEGRARWCVVQGDALAVLAELPNGSVDAVITDPPYSSGGAFRGDRIQDVHTKYVQTDSESGNELAAFAGDTRDQRSYAYWCTLWLGKCLGILRPGGICGLFTDWRQLPSTSDALQAGGFVWRGVVPWYKPNARPKQDRYTNACEFVVWGTNGPRELKGSPLPGFYQEVTPRDRDHITQKPLTIMRGLVQIAPSAGVVLDPFAGSGTTGVAALLEGRRVILVEITDHFAQVARERCAAAETGHDWKNPKQGALFASREPTT